MNQQLFVLTIAGFDPSSGAGLTSDIKTFQAHNLYGLSICTSITIQNDIEFVKAYWVETDTILEQINILFNRFQIDVVKIGIIKNFETLNIIIDRLKTLNSKIKIVLDPILKASSGYDFRNFENSEQIDLVLEKIYLITPNFQEIKELYIEKSIEETIEIIKGKTNLYLKGGHRLDHLGLDQLFYNSKYQLDIKAERRNITAKHGSGCVLSSSIASNLALGYSLKKASILAKKYTEQFLCSNSTLLGKHSMVNV